MAFTNTQTVFQSRMPSGIPGTITRMLDSDVEPTMVAETAVIPYGAATILDANGKVTEITGTTTAAQVWGIMVRPYVSQGGCNDVKFGAGTAKGGTMGDVLKRGYVTVKLGGSTAAKKGTSAYLAIKDDTSSPATYKKGDFLAAAPTTTADAIAFPAVVFMGAADPQGNVEIAFHMNGTIGGAI